VVPAVGQVPCVRVATVKHGPQILPSGQVALVLPGVAAATGALDGSGCAGPAADGVTRGESFRVFSCHRR
jgi:hypothetical protein